MLRLQSFKPGTHMKDPDRKIPMLIFSFVLCVGLFTMQGRLRDSDAFPMILTAESILTKGSFGIEMLSKEYNAVAKDWEYSRVNWEHMEEHQYGARNSEGILYSKYGIMSALIFLPMMAASAGFMKAIAPYGGSHAMWIFFAGCTIPILLALCGVLLYKICRFFDYKISTSAYLALSLTLCSNLLVYGGMFMSEVPQVFFMLMGWYFLFGFILKRKPVIWAFLAGLGYSLMMLTKFADLIYTLPLFFIVVCKTGSTIYDGFSTLSRGEKVDAREFRRSAFGIGALLLGLLIFPSVFYWYNNVRFGDPLTTGYDMGDQAVYRPFYEGLLGFLVSPGKSLFLYFPAAILFFWSIRRFLPKFTYEFWFFAIHALIQIIIYSRLIYWSGFWSWGPRYSLMILPALLIPVGILLEGDAAKRFVKPFRKLCIAGFLIQLPVLLVHFNEFIRLMRTTFGEPLCYVQMFFNPIYSPIICNWWLFFAKLMNHIFGANMHIWGMNTGGYRAAKLFFVTLSRDVPEMREFVYLFVIIVIVCGFNSARALYRRLKELAVEGSVADADVQAV